MAAHGPQQRLYGHHAIVDVLAVDLQDQLRRNGHNVNALLAHHRDAVVFESHLLRCVHCQASHTVTSRVQIEDHRDPKVRWCWSCSDWRCATAACAPCSRGSAHYERKLESVEEVFRKRARLLDEVRRAGLPWQGHDVQPTERIFVAVPAAPKPAGALVIASH